MIYKIEIVHLDRHTKKAEYEEDPYRLFINKPMSAASVLIKLILVNRQSIN